MADFLVLPPSGEGRREGLARYLQTEQGSMLGHPVELSAVRADGTEFPIEIAIGQVEGQTPPLFTGYIRDVSERKRAADEREQLVQSLQGAVHIRDEFLSVASHELRTPLTALQLQVESLRGLLQSGEVSKDKVVHKTELLKRQANRLNRLIEGLLEVSRLSSGQFRLNLEDMDLCSLAEDVVERFEAEAELAGCKVRVDGQPSVTGAWDRLRLEQVLSNLLTNAFKYAPATLVKVTVEEGERGTAQLVVHDEGPGIGPDDIDRIFGRFERAASSRHSGGMGLGLYISRKIVEMHGGSITASSAPGQGSTFTVTIPKSPTSRALGEVESTKDATGL